MRNPWRIAAVCVALALLPGCEGCKEEPGPAPAQSVRQPVPAPEGLLADLYVPTPDATFRKFRDKLGGPAALLPSTFPALVVTMLALPPQLMEQVDENVPSLGVLLTREESMTTVVGIHVKDGDRLLHALTGVPDARYKANKDPSGVVLLEPTPLQTSRVASLAIEGNYLLVADSNEALLRGALYITRTLPTRPPQQGQIIAIAPESALKGAISKRVREGWANYRQEREKQDRELRAKHGGKAPDFGEPAAALANADAKVSRLATLLGDLREARLDIQLDDVGLHAVLGVLPSSDQGFAARELGAMVTGDLQPVLRLPSDTLLGVMVRDSKQTRSEDARTQAKAIKDLMGERMKEPEAAELEKLLIAWSESRGDWMSAGLQWSSQQHALLVRTEPADQAALEKSLRGMVDLHKVKAFQAPLEHHYGKLRVAPPAQTAGLTLLDVKRLTGPDGAKSEPLDFDVAWKSGEGGEPMSVVITGDAKKWFEARWDKPESTLASVQVSTNMLRAVGNDASFALYVQPMQLLAAIAIKSGEARAPSAPVVVAYGGSKERGWFRVDMEQAAAKELVRMLTSRR